MQTRKVDFYCGAFLSYLITNGVEPTLFEAGEKSKILRFTIGNCDYKTFLKYSATPKESAKAQRETTRWDVIFTAKEFEFLKNYSEEGRENIVVIVCTDDQLKNTFFSIINYSDARACLGFDPVNKQRRISITHLKGSSKLSIYGTAINDENAMQIDYNCDKYFGFGGEAQ